MECHLIGDNTFAMCPILLKAFAHRNLSDRQAIYNYRCSRARRVVENCFGIMAACFRVLKSKKQFNEKQTTKIITAGSTLHNIMCKTSGISYMGPVSVDSEDITMQCHLEHGVYKIHMVNPSCSYSHRRQEIPATKQRGCENIWLTISCRRKEGWRGSSITSTTPMII